MLEYLHTRWINLNLTEHGRINSKWGAELNENGKKCEILEHTGGIYNVESDTEVSDTTPQACLRQEQEDELSFIRPWKHLLCERHGYRMKTKL